MRRLMFACLKIWGETHHKIFDPYLFIPFPRELIEVLSCTLFLDVSTYGIITPCEIPLGLEFNICSEVQLRRLDIAMVSELILHLTKQYSSHIHVGLRQEADSVYQLPSLQTRSCSDYVLFLSSRPTSIQYPQNSDTLHHAGS